MLKVPGAKLGILLCSDREIAGYHKKYLNVSGPTDVISFGGVEKGQPDGNLVISLDTTARQAKEYGNSFEYELLFYIAHGLLHLLGWEDETKVQREKMWSKQAALLKKMGIDSKGK